jgi:hypothetical protein
MRKLTMMMGMLLALGLSSACSSDDEMGVDGDSGLISIPVDGTILTPVDSFEGSEDVSIFFSKEMPTGGRSGSFFVNSNKDECCVVNNYRELRSIYEGNNAIPNIDFKQYTLVIGQRIEPDANYPVLKQDLEFSDNKCQLNLYVPKLEGKYTVNYPLYYWALYPKFGTEDISACVIKEGALQFAKDFPGYLHYNSDIDKWYATYKVKGMYEHDEYYIMNPMDIPDEYIANKDDWKISYSGEFFQMSDEAREALQILPLGGQHYRFIYLSKIEKRD